MKQKYDEVIIRIECDEPMARRKGYLPCKKNCKNCLAAIITRRNGERGHVSTIRGKA